MTEAFVAKPSGKARETDYIAAVERIRELEAELRTATAAWSDERARAEKAQDAEARIRQEKAENDLFWSAKVSELQARVAELNSHNHWTKCELCAREPERSIPARSTERERE